MTKIVMTPGLATRYPILGNRGPGQPRDHLDGLSHNLSAKFTREIDSSEIDQAK